MSKNKKDYDLGDQVWFINENKVKSSKVLEWNKSKRFKNFEAINNFAGEVVKIDTVTVYIDSDKSLTIDVNKEDCYPSKEELIASL